MTHKAAWFLMSSNFECQILSVAERRTSRAITCEVWIWGMPHPYRLAVWQWIPLTETQDECHMVSITWTEKGTSFAFAEKATHSMHFYVIFDPFIFRLTLTVSDRWISSLSILVRLFEILRTLCTILPWEADSLVFLRYVTCFCPYGPCRGHSNFRIVAYLGRWNAKQTYQQSDLVRNEPGVGDHLYN